ncbi:MAG: helix-turn-helix domain containing protein [bacterium]|nr:helix-turn-helix domain containing protein [bacterium]
MRQAKPKTPEAPRRGGRTRNALIRAGHKLLAERSIDAVAVDDIVQAAGVAKGSFYTHFEDKQELASAIRADIRREIEAAIAKVNEGVADPAQRVARALAVYIDYILISQQRANVLLRINVGLASTANPLNAGVLHDIADGLRTGRFVTPSVQAGALYVIGVCEIALMHAVEEPSRAGTVMIAQQLGALMLRGLGVPSADGEALIATAIHELISQPVAGEPIA